MRQVRVEFEGHGESIVRVINLPEDRRTAAIARFSTEALGSSGTGD
jgi:hypothetical protein